MLTEKQFDSIPPILEQRAVRLQDFIINELSNNIYNAGELTSTSKYQLEQLSYLNFDRDLKEELLKINKGLENDINSVFEQALKYEKEFKYNKVDNALLERLAKAQAEVMKTEYYNLIENLGFYKKQYNQANFIGLSDFYKDTIDDSIFKVVTGTTTNDKALKGLINEMVRSGVRTIVLDNKNRNVISASRQILQDGVKEFTHEIARQNADILDTDIFEISYHSGFRPTHDWGGQRYAVSSATAKKYGLKTEVEIFKDGNVTDAHCYHDIYAVTPDMPYAYSKSELKELKKQENIKIKSRGKEIKTIYEAKQEQRKLEREMRFYRQQAVAYKKKKSDFSKEQYLINKGKYYNLRKEYISFNKKANLYNKFDRVYIDNLGKI